MPTFVTDTYNYLVFIQLHPLVTVVTLMIIILGRQRWEEVEEDIIKRRKIGQNVLMFSLLISVLGQVALYKPMNSRDVAICVFMAFGQVGVASFIYTFAEKYGLMDRLGKMVQKKMEAQ
jgi:Trk-type K+ transport system membrane component